MTDTRQRWRNRLPHWEVEDRPHFITIRCAGSLPLEGRKKISEIYASIRVTNPASSQFALLQRQYFVTCEKYLDHTTGVRPFADAEAAKIVIAAWTNLEASHGWKIPCYAVMPNHVHFIMESSATASKPLRDSICHFKGKVARLVNKLHGRRGPFWQTDWFDRWLRNEEEIHRVVDYIHNNPVKAGLDADWRAYPWVK
jgi:putative transposase